MLGIDSPRPEHSPSESIQIKRRLIEVALQRLKTDGNISPVGNKNQRRVYLKSSDGNYIWRLTDQEVARVDGQIKSVGDLKSGLLIEGFRTHKDGFPITPEKLPSLLFLPRQTDSITMAGLNLNDHLSEIQATAQAINNAEITANIKYFEDLMSNTLMEGIISADQA